MLGALLWGIGASMALAEENEKVKTKNVEEQLTEAKEIIEKLLEEEKNNMYWEMNGSNKSSYYEVKARAEQFLNSEVSE